MSEVAADPGRDGDAVRMDRVVDVRRGREQAPDSQHRMGESHASTERDRKSRPWARHIVHREEQERRAVGSHPDPRSESATTTLSPERNQARRRQHRCPVTKAGQPQLRPLADDRLNQLSPVVTRPTNPSSPPRYPYRAQKTVLDGMGMGGSVSPEGPRPEEAVVDRRLVVLE